MLKRCLFLVFLLALMSISSMGCGVEVETTLDDKAREVIETTKKEITDAALGKLVENVKLDLASYLNVPVDEIKVVGIKQVELRHDSLEINVGDIASAQIVVPGLAVVLEHNGEEYKYHLDLDGRFVRAWEKQ
ncbi:MAG: hypothetical protein LRZ91_02035 [Desulfotomaculum sp.]|nr:hypothetical protein [Desulfotomaculum sp.]